MTTPHPTLTSSLVEEAPSPPSPSPAITTCSTSPLPIAMKTPPRHDRPRMGMSSSYTRMLSSSTHHRYRISVPMHACSAAWISRWSIANDIPYRRLQSERQLEQRTLEQSSHSYDKHLLSRIGGPNTPKRQSLSYSAGNEGQPGAHDVERWNGSLRPLSLPDRRHASVDSPGSARWPSSGAISPGNSSFWHEHGPTDPSRSAAVHRGSLASEDARSHRDSYDHSMFIQDDFAMEDSQMSNLNLQDRSPGSPKAGSKRRASSPPRDREDRSSVSSASGHSEIYHRRSMQQLTTRASPVSRFQQSSLSSTSSYAPRHGSLASSLGVASVPSSATSYASERISPGGVSPGGDTELRSATSYGSAQSLNPSPNMSHHQRTFSESTQGGTRKPSTDSATHSRNSSLSQIQGVYMCECCPKKPKKFDTEEDLRYVKLRRPIPNLRSLPHFSCIASDVIRPGNQHL